MTIINNSQLTINQIKLIRTIIFLVLSFDYNLLIDSPLIYAQEAKHTNEKLIRKKNYATGGWYTIAKQAPPNCSMQITADNLSKGGKTIFKAGDPVIIYQDFKNQSETAFRIYNAPIYNQGPIYNKIVVHVISVDDNDDTFHAPWTEYYKHKKTHTLRFGKFDPQALQPKTNLRKQFQLNRMFDMSTIGVYRVTMRTIVMPTGDNSLEHNVYEIKSNVLDIEIIDPEIDTITNNLTKN